MPSITLDGMVNRSGRGNDAVVFIDKKDLKRLDTWWRGNRIDTKLGEMYNPVTRKSEVQINANTKAKIFDDRTIVKITIDVRPWKKAGVDRIGIKILEVVRL
ncbi:MAG: hypothetical protein CVU61_14470 [Deltaproteobacteria bacterium HGW-Deltaproteobacteria-19]|jgi:hypothetical protein|nr:MAG: hypothetical protein CVU61_14470 [Deltaproteobacteria bacterium HGW-Deltaproteobacteria-19]